MTRDSSSGPAASSIATGRCGGDRGGGGIPGWHNVRAVVIGGATRRRRAAAAAVGAGSLVASAALWLVVAPLLAAGLYETAFVTTPEAWAQKGPVGALPWESPLRMIALGSFLLHTWVFLCQVGIPRRRAVGVMQPRGEGARGVRAGGARAAGAAGGAGAGAGAGAPLLWRERVEVRMRVYVNACTTCVAFFSAICLCVGVWVRWSVRTRCGHMRLSGKAGVRKGVRLKLRRVWCGPRNLASSKENLDPTRGSLVCVCLCARASFFTTTV